MMQRRWRHVCVGISVMLVVLAGCTQEQQNKLSRSIQNWTGTEGVLDVFSDGKLLYRIIHIDKISTATSTSMGTGGIARPYRFGYGVMDVNFNYKKDPGEKRMYFELSDYSTPYLFYENPLSHIPGRDEDIGEEMISDEQKSGDS